MSETATYNRPGQLRAKNKKSKQLGMNVGTAQHRLRGDVLFRLVQQLGEVCYRCGKPMTRDTFSLEHKMAWLDSDDPVKNFFDLDNIAFSHQSCNYSNARKPYKQADYKSPEWYQRRQEWDRNYRAKQKQDDPELVKQKRRERYLNEGR